MHESFPRGQFGVIYLDPPWKYEMFSDKGKERSPDRHYECMSFDELAAMRDDIVFAAAPNSAMIMWTSWAASDRIDFLQQAQDLMRLFGFQRKTGGPWIKRDGRGNPSMGTGYILRSATELFLLGTHGSPRVRNRSTKNVVFSGALAEDFSDIAAILVDTLRREHSRKPDEMYAMIESLGAYMKAKLLGEPIRFRRTGLAIRDQQVLAQLVAHLGKTGAFATISELYELAQAGALPFTPETEDALLMALADITEMRRLLLRALGLMPEDQPVLPDAAALEDA